MSAAKLTAFLRQRCLPHTPYLIVFWFANKIGYAYRLASGQDFLRRLTRMMGTLNTVMESIWPSFDLTDFTVGVAGAAIVYAIVQIKKKNARKYRKGVEHGSARCAAFLRLRYVCDHILNIALQDLAQQVQRVR